MSPNANCILLVFVIPSSSPIVCGLFDHVQNKLLAVCLRKVQLKPFSELLKHSFTSFETGKVDSRDHRHFNERNQFFGMLSQNQKSFSHVTLEFQKQP